MIYGYARVSTTDQHLSPQIEQLSTAGCEQIMQEKASGIDRERPALTHLLSIVAKGDVIVVTKLDRIARSTHHLLQIVEQLDNQGVAFKVLNCNIDTGTPTGRLMLTMLGAISTFEREMMLERQRDGIARAKAEGKYKGRAPLSADVRSVVLTCLEQGMPPAEVAELCGIGVASVYRIRAGTP